MLRRSSRRAIEASYRTSNHRLLAPIITIRHQTSGHIPKKDEVKKEVSRQLNGTPATY